MFIVDPRLIPRPQIQPEARPGYLTTRGYGKLYPVHVHDAFVDEKGNGHTSISCSHYHKVRANVILPDESDSHSHGLTNIRSSMAGGLSWRR